MQKKVIGYGICGPGEAGRYMKETLECFKRLCDEVIIVCNNCDKAELNLIDSFGFKRVNDRREWGAHQWRIKQDFIERDIKQIANEGDVLVCLDMDEVLSKRCTKEWLLNAPLDAYHVFIVDLWNDKDHFKLESCFWNVRIWKWNGETKYKAKPVHCGLAPEWTYHYHRHAPFLLLHTGLMDKESRERKIKRYEKYDPKHEHLDTRYYDMLKSDTAEPFDEEELSDVIEKEVATYKETKPKKSLMKKPKERFAYVKNPHGQTVDIPERHLAQTLARAGFEFIGYADEQDEEIEEMFADDEVPKMEGEQQADSIARSPESKNNYNRSPADEKAEVDSLNKASDEQFEHTHPKTLGSVASEVTPKDTNSEDSIHSETKANHVADTDEMVVDKPVEKKKPVKKVAKKTTKKKTK